MADSSISIKDSNGDVRSLLADYSNGKFTPIHQMSATQYDAIIGALRGTGLGSSGKTPISGTLTSNSVTTAFSPVAGRTFYFTLSGSGSAVVQPIYSSDGVNFYPEVTAVDGGAPVYLTKIAYNGAVQDGIRVPLQVDQYGVLVKLSPAVVTGTINFTIEQ